MGIKFATDEWGKALMAAVNSSEAYAKAAAHWEGDFYFITSAGKGIPQDTYLYLDLWHGKARDAYMVADPSSKHVAFELALACDLRLAAAGTALGLPETRLGIIPDVGGTTRLTRLVGPARAKELIFTGRRFDAADAEHWGIVQYVVERDALTARADELVAEISLAAPLAVGMAKRVIDGLADVDRGLMLEGWAQSQLFATEDFLEGAQAFMMRRPPQFKGR